MSSQHWILGFHLSLRHSTDISWTLTDVGEKTWLYLFLFLKKLVLLLSDRVLFLWTIGLLWNLKKYFTYTGAFWAYPACITIIPQVFFFVSISSSFTGGHNWPYTQQHEWVPVTPDYQPAWWVWALPPTHTQFKKTSEACSRWSCPLEVFLFPVMERVGSYSPDWVLGSVQAAAVNEVFPPLSCWGFWLRVYLASVLSAHVLAWDQTGENGKQVGPMKPADSVRSMHAVAMADMVTWLLIPISVLKFLYFIGRAANLQSVYTTKYSHWNNLNSRFPPY